MPFAKVETSINFAAQENEILAFWDKMKAFEKLQELRAKGPRWSFLDGPITANNPMGVHHAWGRTYKDAFHRYFAMTGHELRYQNGFDCQGLWVEVEVEKQRTSNRSATSRTSCPATVREHRPVRDRVQGPRGQVRPRRPSSRSASATGWTGTATRTGPSRRTTAEVVLHDVGGEQLHDLGLPQEVPRSQAGLPRLRRDALVRPLRRRPLSRWR